MDSARIERLPAQLSWETRFGSSNAAFSAEAACIKVLQERRSRAAQEIGNDKMTNKRRLGFATCMQ
jgi:hypothetical protein